MNWCRRKAKTGNPVVRVADVVAGACSVRSDRRRRSARRRAPVSVGERRRRALVAVDRPRRRADEAARLGLLARCRRSSRSRRRAGRRRTRRSRRRRLRRRRRARQAPSTNVGSSIASARSRAGASRRSRCSGSTVAPKSSEATRGDLGLLLVERARRRRASPTCRRTGARSPGRPRAPGGRAAPTSAPCRPR